jgi:FkbM family methyltransferase
LLLNLRRLFSITLSKLGTIIVYASKRMYVSEQEKRVTEWFKAGGDKTLRLNYDLDENSLVFDVGGYEGQWASDIFSKYCCTIHIFEPVAEFADKIERGFSRNKKIFVHKFGLSSKSQKAMILLARDSSSLFKQGGQSEEITLMSAADFIRDTGIQNIDLMKINIEGAEYDLLEHVIETGFIRCIKNIQVQFHDFVPNAEQRMKSIQTRLEHTHSLTYQYPFVWENWSIKDNVS